MLMGRGWHDWGGGPAAARSTDPVSIYQPADRP